MSVDHKHDKELERRKVIQIYKYLQALDQLRNPVKKQINDQLWTLWLRELPIHEDIICPFLEMSEIEESGLDYLAVSRPELSTCPEPPIDLLDWIKPGWQKIEIEPEVIVSKDKDSEEEPVEYFKDNEERVAQFEEWSEVRIAWVQRELPARNAMKIFERLYSLYSWLERDSEQIELILGDGILEWKMSQGMNIHHLYFYKR